MRKQWALELEEKFSLPAFVLDARTGREMRKKDQIPLNQFDDQALTFDLTLPPVVIAAGRYHLISKASPRLEKPQTSERVPQLNTEFGSFLYRLSHPLGEYVIDQAKILKTPYSKVVFDVTQHPVRLHQVETLKGKCGYLTLILLTIDSFDREDYLLFSAIDEQGMAVE